MKPYEPTKAEYASLLSNLEFVRMSMQNPNNWSYSGICCNIHHEITGLFMDIYSLWPKFSGEAIYPINVPSVPLGSNYQFECLVNFQGTPEQYMWDRDLSPYAALRWELLEWSIEYLENKLGTWDE